MVKESVKKTSPAVRPQCQQVQTARNGGGAAAADARADNLTAMKIVLKDSLKAVPGFGWATQVTRRPSARPARDRRAAHGGPAHGLPCDGIRRMCGGPGDPGARGVSSLSAPRSLRDCSCGEGWWEGGRAGIRSWRGLRFGARGVDSSAACACLWACVCARARARALAAGMGAGGRVGV